MGYLPRFGAQLTPRTAFAGLALIPLGLLAEGLILQHFQGQAPCPLCILQRAAFLMFALIAAAGAAHNPPRRSAALYAGAMALASLAGLGVAIWQEWSLHHPKFGCGIDVMEQFVNSLPTAKLLPFVFYASGDCAAHNDPILGLTVPQWSLAWFSALLLCAAFLGLRWIIAAPAARST
jgi:protein dithiol:quinone oxidoreductase